MHASHTNHVIIESFNILRGAATPAADHNKVWLYPVICPQVHGEMQVRTDSVLALPQRVQERDNTPASAQNLILQHIQQAITQTNKGLNRLTCIYMMCQV